MGEYHEGNSVTHTCYAPGKAYPATEGDIQLEQVRVTCTATPKTYKLIALRKLSGAFLLASRLGARVDCHRIWEETARNYEFSEPEETPKDAS